MNILTVYIVFISESPFNPKCNGKSNFEVPYKDICKVIECKENFCTIVCTNIRMSICLKVYY